MLRIGDTLTQIRTRDSRAREAYIQCSKRPISTLDAVCCSRLNHISRRPADAGAGSVNTVFMIFSSRWNTGARTTFVKHSRDVNDTLRSGSKNNLLLLKKKSVCGKCLRFEKQKSRPTSTLFHKHACDRAFWQYGYATSYRIIKKTHKNHGFHPKTWKLTAWSFKDSSWEHCRTANHLDSCRARALFSSSASSPARISDTWKHVSLTC